MNVRHEMNKSHVVGDVGEVTLTWFIDFFFFFFAIEEFIF